MSRQVLFNGAILVRPGAATKIDASQFQNIALSGIGTVGLIGEADAGQPHTVQVFTTPAAVKAFYGSGNLVEAAAIVADPGNDPRIPSGAQQIVCYKVNSSTQSTLLWPASPNQIHTFTSIQYGQGVNNITVALAAGSGVSRIVTITNIDAFGAVVMETSPEVGGTGKFTVQYVGAGSAATMTITATSLTTTVTGGPGSENLNLTFANFASLNDVIAAIDSLPGYTATALVTNAISFDPTNLDAVSAIDIKTALTTVYASNFDVSDWINTNSQIITDTLTKGKTGPTTVLTATGLTGGTFGTSANTDWTNGLLAMRGTRINQVVPLASVDGSTAGTGTWTIASVVAAVVAHAKFLSSTAGRNECQAWAGVAMTKTALITQANTSNSEHLCLVGQKIKRARTSDGTIVYMSEWATACALAGMRAGAPLGEPLTWKYVNCLGVSSDSSWSEASTDDVTTLTLNGIIVVNNVLGKGFRIDKCITTFTKMDNDAYTEETIVQIWKAVAFQLRSTLEDIYVGRPGTLNMIQTVPSTVLTVMELFKAAGAITDSLINGTRINAYRNIQVTMDGDKLYVAVTISPTPGINYVLNTIVLVPAKISL